MPSPGSNSGGMNRKLDVGATLNQIFSTYGATAGVLLPLAFGLFLIVAVVDGLLANGSLILLPLTFAVSIIASTLYQGMVVSLVRDVQDGQRDSTVGDLFREASPVILPLIGAGLLAGLGIGIGLILLIVPGLILLTIWAVIAPVIVVERSGVLDAFGRSYDLVKGNGLQVFGVIVIVFLITFVASMLLGVIGGGISDSVGMRILVSLIASTLTAPITALAAATIYFRLLEANGEPAPAAPAYQDPATGIQPPPPPPPPAPPAV